MSNSRRFRRRVAKGAVLFALPPVPDAASPALRSAIARRNAASTSGRCACGAEGRITGRDEHGFRHLVFEHKYECTAHDDAIRSLAGGR